MVGTVVLKSFTSALIETFITDWSSTMTNWAVARATSAIQLNDAFVSLFIPRLRRISTYANARTTPPTPGPPGPCLHQGR